MSDHNPNNRLAELGLKLPSPPKPVASYVPTRRTGNQVFVSGQIPMKEGSMVALGTVPSEVSLEVASKCAKVCTLNALACLKDEIGDLDRVRRIVRVGVFVAADAGFTGHPQVANGCSDLLVELFGERGKHARAAVGCSSLPLNAPVEIEFLFEVAD